MKLETGPSGSGYSHGTMIEVTKERRGGGGRLHTQERKPVWGLMSGAHGTALVEGRVDVPSEHAGEAGLLEQLLYFRLAVLGNRGKDTEGA